MTPDLSNSIKVKLNVEMENVNHLSYKVATFLTVSIQVLHWQKNKNKTNLSCVRYKYESEVFNMAMVNVIIFGL